MFLIIAGGGKFGKKALDYAKTENYITILVDSDQNCFCAKLTDAKLNLAQVLTSPMESLQPNMTYFLNQDVVKLYELLTMFQPEYVIPVVPVHLMALMIVDFFDKNDIELHPSHEMSAELVGVMDSELIINQSLEEGIILLSYAKENEICPDNCIGPKDFCPNFKREKPITITDYLKEKYDMNQVIRMDENKDGIQIIIILESQQLMPGLGGLYGKDIQLVFKDLHGHLDLLKNHEFKIGVATTCNCHGVINLFKSRP